MQPAPAPNTKNVPNIFDDKVAKAQVYRVRANGFLIEQLTLRGIERLQALKDVPRHVALFGLRHPALATAFPDTVFSAATIDHNGQVQIDSKASHILDLGTLALVNDLPGALAQIHAALPPGGGFFSVLYGGTSLHEVRQAILTAETKLTGGATPRLHPTLSGEAALQLLQRAGFASPIADRELMAVGYKTMHSLARDLREAGLSNRLTARSRTIPPRQLFRIAEKAWQAEAPTLNERALATFEIVALTGWKTPIGNPKGTE